MELWQHTGVDSNKSWFYNRRIILCNWVSVIFSGATLFLGLLFVFIFGWTYSAQITLAAALLYALPITLNKRGLVNLSRTCLSVFLIITPMLISIFDKFDRATTSGEFQFFEFRVMMLGVSIIPLLIFGLQERKFVLPLMSLNLLAFLSFDPLHHLAGVGYYDQGFSGPYYYFFNIIFILTFLILAGSTYFLKLAFEQYEQKNERLIKTLYHANEQLETKNRDIAFHQEELLRANIAIEEQRELLQRENEELNHELVSKNYQLTQSNRELIRHNNELTQFSYTISHNLRGPVASLIGLVNLLRSVKESERTLVVDHISQSVLSLDSIIKDLSHIIDYRHSVTQFRQMVVLEDEVSKIRDLLKKMIDDNQAIIETDFSAVKEILSVKAMINSILYNLVSNAIKYRSQERSPLIRITSRIEGDYVRFDVADNGLGFDVERIKGKLFGLYKRFHSHTEGKGLGLFLVKLQAEALDGRVEVRSVPGEGTTFSVFIKLSGEAYEQLLTENAGVRIYFDALHNAIVCHWRAAEAREGYEDVFATVCEFMKNYHVPNWVSDLSVSGDRHAGFVLFRSNYWPQLPEYGVRSAAIVAPRGDRVADHSKEADLLKEMTGIEVRIHADLPDAIAWVKERNLRERERQALRTDALKQS